jgi:hypothetical protein
MVADIPAVPSALSSVTHTILFDNSEGCKVLSVHRNVYTTALIWHMACFVCNIYAWLQTTGAPNMVF